VTGAPDGGAAPGATGLLERTRLAATRALAEGALQPLVSERHDLAFEGLPYVVRRITSFRHKPKGSRETDPFRPPYTDALYVEDWPPAHALLLNKFPVLADHLLIVTRAWADQEEPPDAADWEALDRALAAVDGLGFYNGGREAGASQPHRHLQLVSREALGPLPFEPALQDALARGRDRVERWPFAHVVLPQVDAEVARRAFRLAGRDPDRPGPHNLLRTRDWLLLVPRRTANVGGIPINALGYVGLLAVKDDAQLERVRREGPFPVLADAAM